MGGKAFGILLLAALASWAQTPDSSQTTAPETLLVRTDSSDVKSDSLNKAAEQQDSAGLLYLLQLDNFSVLKEAFIDSMDDSLGQEISVLEQSAKEAAADGMIGTASDFLGQATALLEDWIATPAEPTEAQLQSRPGEWRRSNEIGAAAGFTRLGISAADTIFSLATDTLISATKPWNSQISWNYSIERTANTSIAVRNRLALSDIAAENSVSAEVARQLGLFRLEARSDVRGNWNLPGNAWGDSTTGIAPAGSIRCKVGRSLNVGMGLSECIYKHQFVGYLNYLEPWFEASAGTPDMAALGAETSFRLSVRRHLSPAFGTENEERASGSLTLRLTIPRFSTYCETRVERSQKHRFFHDGDYLLAEQSLSGQFNLAQWAKPGLRARAERTYYVLADSTGGYRYRTTTITATPEFVWSPWTGWDIKASYDFVLSRNRDNSSSQISGIPEQDYQTEGLGLELQWMQGRSWVSLGNRYRFQDAKNSQSFLVQDEISNQVFFFCDLPVASRTSLSLTGEWTERYQTTGRLPPDLVSEVRLSYRR